MISHGTSFSVVIPTYHRPKELFDCLSCLDHYFKDRYIPSIRSSIQVIVTDDGSDPMVASLLAQHYPWCTYTSGPRRGPAANRNHGASLATGEWIVFTDDDCLPQPGWIEAFAAWTDYFDVLEGSTLPFGIRRCIDEECPVNETGGYLWSCNFAIRRQLFDRLGGFNETFPAAAMEDVELRRRIVDSGTLIKFIPDASVLHPWRRRKGRRFLKLKALSTAAYVSLYPQLSPSFSLASEIRKFLILSKNSILLSISSRTHRGLVRQLFLDAYLAVLTWRAVKRS